jgi:hypothetical protein
MASRFPRLFSLLAGGAVYAAVFGGGCAVACALASPTEPVWTDDKLPAAAVDGLMFLWLVVPACQAVAFGAGVVAGVWTYSRLMTTSTDQNRVQVSGDR